MPGPYYFAYVNEGTAFNAAVHNVNDEEIDGYVIEGEEGDFPALEITLKNPRVGPLAPGRKQWAWFSFDKGYPGVADIVPLFYGRVVAVPNDIQKETISLSFIAKPSDFQEQKETLAAGMRAAGGPYWDPIWFDPEKINIADNVWESRPELIHIDRVTHVVSSSNIASGEDGNLSFTAAEVSYDDMSVTYGETPLRSVRMRASVEWDMAATEAFDISKHFEWGAYGTILTYTGKGLIDRWPDAGTSLGNDWKVEFGEAVRIDTNGPNVYYINRGLFPGSVDYLLTYRPPGGVTAPVELTKHYNVEHGVRLFVPLYLKDWLVQGQERIAQILKIMRWRVKPTMIVRYDTSRKYSEVLTIDLNADVQSIVTDAGGEDVLELTMSSSQIASPIDPGDALPIGDIRRRSYFLLDRGARSIEYLICIMRARLLARARAVDIEFEIPFMRAINDGLSCRKNASFPDPRLPGGTVAGKIKGYRIELDGATGFTRAFVTIGCMIGHGGTVVAVPGEADYIVDDYIEPTHFQHVNAWVMPVPGEVLYRPLSGTPNDDGLDLLHLGPDNVIKSLVIENTWEEQELALRTDTSVTPPVVNDGSNETPREVFDRLDPIPTRFNLTMRPAKGGPFLTTFALETSDLKIPQTYNSEAPSV